MFLAYFISITTEGAQALLVEYLLVHYDFGLFKLSRMKNILYPNVCVSSFVSSCRLVGRSVSFLEYVRPCRQDQHAFCF
jgi:hypothetical protein